MRVSFESGLEMTSFPGVPTSNRQQPTPRMVTVVVSLMQWPCGTAVPGGVPEPGCFCFGGMAYSSDVNTLLLRLSAGVAVSSDDVYVSVQTTI